MANIDRPCGFRAVVNLGGGAIPMYPAKVKIGTSLRPGDAIIKLSGGTVDIATASSAKIYGVNQTEVTGGAALVPCIYVPATPSILFEGQTSGTYTPVNEGELCDIEGTTGIMEINEDAQSVNVVRLFKLADEIDNAAGANARVLFTFV